MRRRCYRIGCLAPIARVTWQTPRGVRRLCAGCRCTALRRAKHCRRRGAPALSLVTIGRMVRLGQTLPAGRPKSTKGAT